MFLLLNQYSFSIRRLLQQREAVTKSPRVRRSVSEEGIDEIPDSSGKKRRKPKPRPEGEGEGSAEGEGEGGEKARPPRPQPGKKKKKKNARTALNSADEAYQADGEVSVDFMVADEDIIVGDKTTDVQKPHKVSSMTSQPVGPLFVETKSKTQPSIQSLCLTGKAQPSVQSLCLTGKAQPAQSLCLTGKAQPAQSLCLTGKAQPAQSLCLTGKAQPSVQSLCLTGKAQPSVQSLCLTGKAQPAQSLCLTGWLSHLQSLCLTGKAQPSVQSLCLTGKAQPAQSLFYLLLPSVQSLCLTGKAQPAQSLFYLLLAICTVSVFDSYDVARPNRRFFRSLLTPQSGAISILVYLISIIFSVSIASIDDRIGLFVDAAPTIMPSDVSTATVATTNQNLWTDSDAANRLYIWRIINTMRVGGAILGWLIVALNPTVDHTSEHLYDPEDSLVATEMVPRNPVA
uniref:Uncharacterized protein n=1 Tax=Branchiostoma floridae TaxID=7739 RepID=C3XW73_BRAFL|eukprot:XP_002611597.1 hypothetical protein BRAFLDRAFT_117153 [Branchiostoma floridae]